MTNDGSLAEQAAALTKSVNKLNADVGDQMVSMAKVTKRNERLIVGLIISFILDVTLTVFMAFGMVVLKSNTDDIQVLTDKVVAVQTVQRQKALCPLYQLFLDSKSEVGRARAPDPVKYDQAFVVIQQGFDALKCTELANKSVSPFKK